MGSTPGRLSTAGTTAGAGSGARTGVGLGILAGPPPSVSIGVLSARILMTRSSRIRKYCQVPQGVRSQSSRATTAVSGTLRAQDIQPVFRSTIFRCHKMRPGPPDQDKDREAGAEKDELEPGFPHHVPVHHLPPL